MPNELDCSGIDSALGLHRVATAVLQVAESSTEMVLTLAKSWLPPTYTVWVVWSIAVVKAPLVNVAETGSPRPLRMAALRSRRRSP